VAPEARAALPFAPQAVGVRTEEYKLLRNPGVVPNAPDAVDGRVLIHIAEDPKEDMNVVASEPAVVGSLEGRLAEWFQDIKDEPHSFHTPHFVIGPGATNVVYLYAPVRIFGSVQNGALRSNGWHVPGDAAEYFLQVRKPGRYTVSLESERLNAGSLTLRVRMGERDATLHVSDADSRPCADLELSAGEHVLRLETVSADASEGSEASSLRALRFEPSSAR
jgi:hypothetical protein